MLLLDIIKAKLVSAGVVNNTTWKCFVGFCPDVQDQVVSLHLSGGFPQDTHENDNVIETFQCRIRAARLDYAACEAKWRQVFNALQDADLSANGIRMIQAMASGPLEWYDENQRPNMTINFRVVRDKP